jgi:peptidyl-prolyl cis-trans isomerase D
MLTKIQDAMGKWVAGVILALIAGGFIFWDINFQLSAPNYAAKVNGAEIPLEEFERTFQQQQAQYQQLYRIDLDDQVRRQIRRSVLDRLVQQEALTQRVRSEGYRVSDARLAESIRSIEAFQVGGDFNLDAYRTFLANQGLSPAAFEAMQRQQLALVDWQDGIAQSSFLTPNEFRRYIELADQQRQVGYALFEAASFKDKVEVKDDEIATYYDENKDRFMTEEAASLEYIELTRADAASSINVSDQELQQYYDEHKNEFGTQEERHAEHILITKQDDETDEQTKARAEAVLARVQGGEDFAAVAKEVSQDPGTAQQGGDLGWIGPGMLAGPFEDALFAMKDGEIRGPVKTDFGYHIIRLVDIRPSKVQPLADVRDKLLEQLRNDRADSLFYEQSNKLADEAFDAYDQLETVARDLNLSLKMAERFPRSGDPSLFKDSAPVVDAVFGNEALETGVNSGLIKLSDNDVVVLNVKERFPPQQKPLDEVKDQIRETLVQQRAAGLASEAAAAYAAALPKEVTAEYLGIDEDAGAGEAAVDAPAASGDAKNDGAKAADGKGGDANAADTKAGDAKAGEAKGGEAKTSDTKGTDTKAAAAGKGSDAKTESASEAPASPAAALAAQHGGSWVAPKWIERSSADVPSQVLVAAFSLAPPKDDMVARDSVRLATGDEAVLFVADVKLGTAETLTDTARDQARQEMAQSIGGAELGAYATSVRDEAKVRVPDQVLEPQQP